MSCEICGRNNCTRSFHSLEEQEEYDNNIGDRIEDAKDKLKIALMARADELYWIEHEGEYWVRLDDVIDMIDNYD
jgi:hypothetical protein